jgi:hypothetical protein
MIFILPPPIARMRVPTLMTTTMMMIVANHRVRCPPSMKKSRDSERWNWRRAQIIVVRMMPPCGQWAMDDVTDNVKTYGHCGGEDGDGTKTIMLLDHHCQRLAACARSTGRRAQIVVVRMMPPHGRWAMDEATDDAKTYGHCGGEDGDGTKTMMLRDHHCWQLVACTRSAGRRALIVVVRIMPPRGRWAMDNAMAIGRWRQSLRQRWWQG